MTPSNQDKNKKGVLWGDFSQEVAHALKHYLLIKVSKSQGKKIVSMWRQGYSATDAISYVILSSK